VFCTLPYPMTGAQVGAHGSPLRRRARGAGGGARGRRPVRARAVAVHRGAGQPGGGRPAAAAETLPGAPAGGGCAAGPPAAARRRSVPRLLAMDRHEHATCGHRHCYGSSCGRTRLHVTVSWLTTLLPLAAAVALMCCIHVSEQVPGGLMQWWTNTTHAVLVPAGPAGNIVMLDHHGTSAQAMMTGRGRGRALIKRGPLAGLLQLLAELCARGDAHTAGAAEALRAAARAALAGPKAPTPPAPPPPLAPLSAASEPGTPPLRPPPPPPPPAPGGHAYWPLKTIARVTSRQALLLGCNHLTSHGSSLTLCLCPRRPARTAASAAAAAGCAAGRTGAPAPGQNAHVLLGAAPIAVRAAPVCRCRT